MVTSDDTTEYVDKDSGNLGIASDEIEGILDGCWSGPSTDVQEVGWLTAIEFDDVHGSHGKTGAVDQASNVAV